jgi:hypothetical protein
MIIIYIFHFKLGWHPVAVDLSELKEPVHNTLNLSTVDKYSRRMSVVRMEVAWWVVTYTVPKAWLLPVF